ncbi:hypothetical protein D9M68_558420 [compost metagenome]
MKKLILLIAIIAVAGLLTEVKAQNATNSASDFRVPLTSPPPQANPAIGVNAVNAPALNVPTAPFVQTITTPAIVGTLSPSIPAAPAPPPAPAPGTLPPAATFTTTLNLPVVPVLPPVPPIPAMPDIRLPIGVN